MKVTALPFGAEPLAKRQSSDDSGPNADGFGEFDESGAMQALTEMTGVDARRFHADIVGQGRPVVLRGAVADWAVVRAAAISDEALAEYLRRFDRGATLSTMFGPPAIEGRFFYNADLTAFNFQVGSVRLGAALDYLLAHRAEPRPPAFAVQSVPVRANLTGFEQENRTPLLDPAIEPRVWLGNRVIVAAHHDPSENLACVTAGRRRFTLFPPEQVANLYPGPFELTPAGTTISMVDFDKPDLGRYPRFAEALDAGLVAELAPGDAIYIPYLWWHHVRSLEPVSMLVNYWWDPPTKGRGAPRDAFLHAILTFRGLPPEQRAAWRAMLDHYVFDEGGVPGGHLPERAQGILGPMDAATARDVRAALARTLAKG
ncbi:MAG: peptidylprolyl isomerase [Caulobacter sp.]|nr:peptidylprolyl isomerase [Caulobacter sp.]